MKTLLVYYSKNNDVKELCEASGTLGNVDVIELRQRYEKGMVWNTLVENYRAFAGTGTLIENVDINISDYDSVIIATSLKFMNPSPEINDFLHRTNLLGCEVFGLIIQNGSLLGGAGDALRKRISLAGGSCRGIVSVSAKELRDQKCDIYSFAKQKAAI